MKEADLQILVLVCSYHLSSQDSSKSPQLTHLLFPFAILKAFFIPKFVLFFFAKWKITLTSSGSTYCFVYYF